MKVRLKRYWIVMSCIISTTREYVNKCLWLYNVTLETFITQNEDLESTVVKKMQVKITFDVSYGQSSSLSQMDEESTKLKK